MRRYALLDSDNKITLLREVNDDEYFKFCTLSDKFGYYILEVEYSKIFDKAYKELITVFKQFLSNNNLIELSDLNRYTLDYLFAVRTFLDHWETHIKREYRDNHEYIDLFKNATRHEHYNHMAYRIVYRLRNYVQHCEMPISCVTERLNDKDEKELLVYVNRDRLLSNFNEWKSDEITYLKTLEQDIEILPLFDEMNDCLFRIHNKLINFNVNEDFMVDCISVLKLRKQFKEYTGALAVFEYSDEDLELKGNIFADGNIKMKVKQLPDPICENILKAHIRNNEKYVKVFNLYGKCIGETDKSFPHVLDKEEDGTILFIKGNDKIRVNNRTWLRLFESTSIGDKYNYTSVYADVRFGMEKLTKLADFYGDLCKVLYRK